MGRRRWRFTVSPIEFASPHDAPNVICVDGADAWRPLPAALRQSIAQMVEGSRVGTTFGVAGELVAVILDFNAGMKGFRRAFELMERVAEYHEAASRPGATA